MKGLEQGREWRGEPLKDFWEGSDLTTFVLWKDRSVQSICAMPSVACYSFKSLMQAGGISQSVFHQRQFYEELKQQSLGA